MRRPQAQRIVLMTAISIDLGAAVAPVLAIQDYNWGGVVCGRALSFLSS